MEQLYPPRIKSMRNGSARLNEEGMKPRCLHELEQYSTLKREEIALEMQKCAGKHCTLTNLRWMGEMCRKTKRVVSIYNTVTVRLWPRYNIAQRRRPLGRTQRWKLRIHCPPEARACGRPLTNKYGAYILL